MKKPSIFTNTQALANSTQPSNGTIHFIDVLDNTPNQQPQYSTKKDLPTTQGAHAKIHVHRYTHRHAQLPVYHYHRPFLTNNSDGKHVSGLFLVIPFIIETLYPCGRHAVAM
jgi:hypothetical protein